MSVNTFALHETLELNEVAGFKSICLTKAKTMQMLVSDPELKQLMQDDVKLTTRQLNELNGLMSKAMLQGVKA